MTEIATFIESCRNTMRLDTTTESDQQRIWQLGWMIFLKVFSDKELEMEEIKEGYRSVIPAELQWKNWAGDDEGMTGNDLVDFVNEKLFPTLKKIEVAGNKRAMLVQKIFANSRNHMQSGVYLRQVINKLNEIDFNARKDRQVFGEIYEIFLSKLQSAGALGEFYTPRAVTNVMTALVNPRQGEKVLDPACGTGGFLTAAVEHLKANTATSEQFDEIGENVIGWEYKHLPYLLANTNLILHGIDQPSIHNKDSFGRPLRDYEHKDRVDVILANPPFGGIVSQNFEKNFPQIYQTRESADLFLILMIELLKDGGRAAIILPDSSLTGDGIKERIREKLLNDCNLHTIVRLPNTVFYRKIATNLLFFTKGKATKNVWYWEHKLPEGYKAYSKTKPIQYGEFDGLRKWWGKRKAGEQAWQVSIEEIAANGYNLDIKNPNRQEEEEEHDSGELLNRLRQSFAKSDNLLSQLEQGLRGE